MKIPKDELFLAKLIQNAKASGLSACRYANYRDRFRHYQAEYNPNKTAFCCAVGAALIDPETADRVREDSLTGALQNGNDHLSSSEKPVWAKKTRGSDWVEVGQAFFDACRKPKANE